MTNIENLNSLDEFEKYIKTKLKMFGEHLKEPHNSFLGKVLKEINSYKEELLSEQRERDYNSELEQKEIE